MNVPFPSPISPKWGEFAPLWLRLAAAPFSLLLLDYDGTLAPFREDPAEARPYVGVEPLVRELLKIPHTHVAFITGRSLDSILQLLKLEPLPEIWASHGRERRYPGGEVETVSPREVQKRALVEAKRWISSAGLADSLEEKPFSLAVHVRRLPVTEQVAVLGRVREGWEPIADGAEMELLPFDGGLELRAPGWTKGDAVRVLVGEAPQGCVAVYLGDDETDEDAFRVLNELDGFPLLVRRERRTTAAKAWLKPPEELLLFLEGWLAIVRRAKHQERS